LFSNVKEFFSKLVHQWIVYLAVLPYISDIASNYFGYDISIPLWISLSIISLALIVATYRVWEDEKKAYQNLEAQFKNPVDYSINAKLYPFDFEFDKVLARLNKNLSDAENEYEKIGKPDFGGLQISFKIDGKPAGYRYELETYIKELRSVIDTWDEQISKALADKKYYFVKFFISNAGHTSDENIHVEISILNGELYTQSPIDVYPAFPEKPEKPKEPYQEHFSEMYQNRLFTDILPPFSHEPFNAKRKKFSLDKNIASIIIRDINVGESIDLFAENIYLNATNKVEMDAIIKSKKSTAVIKKDVNIELQNTSLNFSEIMGIDN